MIKDDNFLQRLDLERTTCEAISLKFIRIWTGVAALILRKLLNPKLFDRVLMYVFCKNTLR
jgi:hypothetical protein